MASECMETDEIVRTGAIRHRIIVVLDFSKE
jgi:hypothetical protein